MRLADQGLWGRTVIAAGGEVVGEVTAVFVDTDTWSVESLQVRLAKHIADEIGADRNLFHAGTLDLPVRMIQSAGDTIVLYVTVPALQEALPRPKAPAE